MAKAIYYRSSRGEEGPFSFDAISSLVDEGYIGDRTMVMWNDHWELYSDSQLSSMVNDYKGDSTNAVKNHVEGGIHENAMRMLEDEHYNNSSIWVYDEQNPDNRWTTATIMEASADGDMLRIVTDMHGEESYLDTLTTPVLHANLPFVDEEEYSFNLVNLPHTHEAALLHHLSQRFRRKQRYTYIGDTILVALTAFGQEENSRLPEMSAFTGEGMTVEEHHNFLTQVPHPWSFAEKILLYLKLMLTSQTLVMMGESGSGKTTSSNLIINYLLARNDGLITAAPEDHFPESYRRQQVALCDTIEHSMQCLNSFGHALVYGSVNSSRYGKLTHLFYNARQEDHKHYGERDMPNLVGARTECILLEKSRVVEMNENERNFHVFYQLLAAVDTPEYEALAEYGLGRPDQYKILIPSQGSVLGSKSKDREGFLKMLDALSHVGFSQTEVLGMLRVLVGILHLGNLVFDEEMDEFGMVHCVVRDIRVLDMAAYGLGVESDSLFNAITTVRAGSIVDTHTMQRSALQSSFVKEQVCKYLYEAIFVVIMKEVNHCLHTEMMDDVIAQYGGAEPPSICLVDFPGFVNSEMNAFEHFLMNYANESLQHTFNRKVFDAYLNFYNPDASSRAEDRAQCPSSDVVMELIENPSYGILSTLEKVTAMDAEFSTDDTFISLINKSSSVVDNKAYHWGGNADNYTGDDVQFSVDPATFVVQHFEGAAKYFIYPSDVEVILGQSGHSWISRNKDELPNNLVGLCLSSVIPELRALCTHFQSTAQISEKYRANLSSASFVPGSGAHTVTTTIADKSLLKPEKEKNKAGKFMTTMKELHRFLMKTNTNHIKHIAANHTMSTEDLDRVNICRQCNNFALSHCIEVFKVREPCTIPFESIMRNLDSTVDLIRHAFVQRPNFVIIACILYATELPEASYFIEPRHENVYIDARHMNQALYGLRSHHSGTDAEEQFVRAIMENFKLYDNTVAMTESAKIDLAKAKDNVVSCMELKEKVIQLCDYGTKYILDHNNQNYEGVDIPKLTSDITEAKMLMAKHFHQMINNMKKVDECEDNTQQNSFYARHCWLSLAEEGTKKFHPLMRDLKFAIQDLSSMMVKVVENFESHDFLAEQAKVIAESARQFVAAPTKKIKSATELKIDSARRPSNGKETASGGKVKMPVKDFIPPERTSTNNADQMKNLNIRNSGSSLGSDLTSSVDEQKQKDIGGLSHVFGRTVDASAPSPAAAAALPVIQPSSILDDDVSLAPSVMTMRSTVSVSKTGVFKKAMANITPAASGSKQSLSLFAKKKVVVDSKKKSAPAAVVPQSVEVEATTIPQQQESSRSPVKPQRANDKVDEVVVEQIVKPTTVAPVAVEEAIPTSTSTSTLVLINQNQMRTSSGSRFSKVGYEITHIDSYNNWGTWLSMKTTEMGPEKFPKYTCLFLSLDISTPARLGRRIKDYSGAPVSLLIEFGVEKYDAEDILRALISDKLYISDIDPFSGKSADGKSRRSSKRPTGSKRYSIGAEMLSGNDHPKIDDNSDDSDASTDSADEPVYAPAEIEVWTDWFEEFTPHIRVKLHSVYAERILSQNIATPARLGRRLLDNPDCLIAMGFDKYDGIEIKDGLRNDGLLNNDAQESALLQPNRRVEPVSSFNQSSFGYGHGEKQPQNVKNSLYSSSPSSSSNARRPSAIVGLGAAGAGIGIGSGRRSSNISGITEKGTRRASGRPRFSVSGRGSSRAPKLNEANADQNNDNSTSYSGMTTLGTTSSDADADDVCKILSNLPPPTIEGGTHDHDILIRKALDDSIL